MAKKNKNSFGGGNSFGRFEGSVFSGSTPKVKSYRVKPIEGSLEAPYLTLYIP